MFFFSDVSFDFLNYSDLPSKYFYAYMNLSWFSILGTQRILPNKWPLIDLVPMAHSQETVTCSPRSSSCPFPSSYSYNLVHSQDPLSISFGNKQDEVIMITVLIYGFQSPFTYLVSNVKNIQSMVSL